MFVEGKANFQGITGGNSDSPFVSKAIQKAFIEVNEEGSEAAAATAAVTHVYCLPSQISQPIDFICDRPFVFLIKDNLTGMILFSGHVIDPTKQ